MRPGRALAIAVLAAMLPGGASPAASLPTTSLPAARPTRILSLNLCTDQLLLALVGPERIASVTWMARDPIDSAMAAQAARVPINHGLAEDVLRQKPDLILMGDFGVPMTRALVARFGFRTMTVPQANDFASIRAVTRQVAAAVGERARGEAMIAAMDADLATLARAPKVRARVAVWDGSGFGAPPGSLFNRVIEATGAVNVARGLPADVPVTPDVERLLMLKPDLLVQGVRGVRDTGLRANVSRHRLVRRLWGNRTLFPPQSAFMCGTPAIGREALALQAQLRKAVGR